MVTDVITKLLQGELFRRIMELQLDTGPGMTNKKTTSKGM
jgi:hypothetical protein